MSGIKLPRRLALTRLGALATGTLLTSGTFAVPAAASATTPRRIVSVGGALTEIVYALGAQGELVGVDTTSLFPAQARQLPSVGYMRDLSLEGVLALRPSHLIGNEDAGPPAVLRELAAAGITVQIMDSSHRFEGLLDRVKRIGLLTGRAAVADTLAQSLQQQWQQTRSHIAQQGVQPLRILFVMAHAPNQVMVAGRDTRAHAMLEYAGAVNAVGTLQGYKPLTPEAVIGARPDVILVTEQGIKASGGVDAILKLPGMAQTPAARQRRVLVMEANYLLGFGPRMPAALAELVNGLHAGARA